MSKRYLISTKKHFFKGLVAGILNLVIWFYVGVIVMLFVSALFDFNTEWLRILKTVMRLDNEGIRGFMFISFLWFLLSFAILWIWRKYNYKRYAHLNRRQYPSDTTMEEMLDLDLIPVEIYKELQNNKVTILQTSPVRDINAKKEEAV